MVLRRERSASRGVPAGKTPATGHPAGFREITRVLIACPGARQDSVTSRMAPEGVIAFETGAKHRLELEFDGGRLAKVLDFSPALPLFFRW